VVGHSLGGSLASLLGATFGVPVVAFEAPGEKLAASRLHLPSPVNIHRAILSDNLLTTNRIQPSLHHITHVYHTADVVAMGTCTGVTSVCGIGGYAMESQCVPICLQPSPFILCANGIFFLFLAVTLAR
jgi:putative lipase involved disintegration of autophagic bodies